MKIFINFKAYPAGIGQRQIELLDFLDSFVVPPDYPDLPASPDFHLVVPATEIAPIWEKYNFPLWAQHCDPVETARATGWISAQMLQEAGAVGTMLNHSEHRLPFSIMEKTVAICRQNNLKILICCQNVEEGRMFVEKLKPDFLAFEPPELIASKTESVISNPPSHASLTSLISQISPTPFLIGAGIHTQADILEAEKLGVAGVLLSSAVMEGGKEEIEKLLCWFTYKPRAD